MSTKINMNHKKIGIIAGSGLLPSEVIKKLDGKVEFCIAAIHGNANECDYKSYNMQIFKIGEVGAAINYFRANNVTDIIMVGAVKRPNFKNLKLDSEGAKLIANIIPGVIKGDDYILRKVSKFFEERGFKILDSRDIISEAICKKGVLTKIRACEEDLVDIETALAILNDLSKFDIGQAIMIEDGLVLGIEAAEGTSELIKRCALLRKNLNQSGILVKAAKKKQDLRLDMPAIGPDTITDLHKFGFKGLALKSGRAIIIEFKKTISLADELGLFVIGY